MPVNYPPVPVFPNAIDSDYTLFLVHNTVETVITADNEPWSSEILIQPVRSDGDEIWSENGFANISGELLYYDSVEKNAYGKIIRLKNCIRNLDGEPTRFNIEGEWIRSYVLAEHHNQISLALQNLESYIGPEICEDTDTLVCCLEELDVTDCPDDGNCVNVDFSYTILSTDTCEGTLIGYATLSSRYID